MIVATKQLTQLATVPLLQDHGERDLVDCKIWRPLQNFITKPTLQSDSVIDPINIIKDMGLMCYTPVKSIPFSVVARSLTTLLQFFLTLYPQNSQTSSSYLSNEANTELPLSFSPFYTARPKHKLFF
jgi:hypothetical protein